MAPPPEVVAPRLLSVRAEAGCTSGDLEEVVAAARRTLCELTRFGPPRSPVTVVIEPSHAALEAAVHRAGWGWLRAWARYDVVYVQAPHSWGLFQGTPAQLDDTLAHELSHCAMFQAAAGPEDWVQRDIPLWFREGLASWAAGQGRRRWSPARLAAALTRHPALDPLEDGEALSRDQPDLVYSAAHWAFVELHALSGDAGLRKLLAAMKDGAAFSVAFHRTLGLSVWEFEAAFRRSLASR